jgi:ribosomal protein S18 acetylase RimI-like enzyme
MTDPAPLSFELATAADAEAFVALERKVKNPKLYGPTLDTDAAVREIAKNKLYFLKRDGVVVGMAAYRPVPEGGVYISNVNIDPACHRQGLARAAMNFLLEKNKGASRIELVTHPENEAALGLYTSLGFQIKKRRENYFGDGEPRVELARSKAG